MEFDFEKHWKSDEEADRKVWLRTLSKLTPRGRREKRRFGVWVSAVSVAVAALVTAAVLLLVPRAAGSRSYHELELENRPGTFESFSAYCLEHGFSMPDTERYMMDFEMAEEYFAGETVYAVMGRYLYNLDIQVQLFMTDDSAVRIETFSAMFPVEEIDFSGKSIQRQIIGTQRVYFYQAGNQRYSITIEGEEADAKNVLYSIFGGEP